MSAETHDFLQSAWVDNPFDSGAARKHSSYAAHDRGEVVPLLETVDANRFARTSDLVFRDFVLAPGFSCLAAKSAIRRGTYRTGSYERLDDAEVTQGLARDLFAFVHERRGFESDFTTFVAQFRDERRHTEGAFERHLWMQLQRLHDIDAEHHVWDPSVSSDPDDPTFSFSFAGSAFFVIGLHPLAARTSRRFTWPTLVFNAHEQFENLKATGAFAGLQEQIRRREIALDGEINVNLADFGYHSEARQYSGRAVGEDWHCPFRARPPKLEPPR